MTEYESWQQMSAQDRTTIIRPWGSRMKSEIREDRVREIKQDPLTGLLTRKQFFMDAYEVIHRAEADGTYDQYAIIYTNICKFKHYNVRFGVDTGDAVLREIAGILQADDAVEARFSSDHFVILTRRSELEERLLLAAQRFEENYGQFGIKLKVGVYEINDQGISLERACDLAAFACDSIKDAKSVIKFFDQEMSRTLRKEAYVIQNLEQALEDGSIQVYYQPIIRSINGALCGLEALARWRTADYGFISPGEFIPALENNQQITRLDLHVLNEVCRDIRRKQELGYITVPVSINLSRFDFISCDIFNEVEHAVLRHGIARDMLCIEITESMIISDPELLKDVISRFREAGYQVWMDDFGSGYSSLNVLDDYTFDEIKLDMKFLRRFDQKSKQLIRSIISMAKELKLETLAEGVETQEQYDFLREIGCGKVQGYLFSRPLPQDELHQLYLGREQEIETRLWHRYYEQLGKINFITDRPLAIVDYNGDSFHMLYVNQQYRNVWKELHIDGEQAVSEMLNAKASPLYVQYRNLLNDLKTDDDYHQLEYAINGQHVRLRAKLIYQEQEHKLCIGELINLTHTIRANTDQKDYVYRMMYAMYDSIYLLDLRERMIEPVMPGSNYHQLNILSQKQLDINWIAESIIEWEDQADFLEFINPATLVDRIRQEEKYYITKLFRTRAANGSYLWTLHTVQLIPGTQKVIYSYRYVPNMYEQMRSRMEESIVFYKTGEALWDTLYRSQNVNIFWKDANRRFIGANQKFLKTFGFSSLSEIIGKTDEDMRWHLDDDSFREDELRVLKEGRSIQYSPGKCIIKGVIHDILTSKEPTYSNGHLTGLVGTFIDLKDIGNDYHPGDELSLTDELTGLMSSHGIANTAREYMENWEYRQEKFAIITVIFESYKRAERTYGSRATREILRKIGEWFSEECAQHLTVGRVYGASFVLFAKYENRSEVDWIPESIHSQCRSIREIAGYPVTLDPKVKIFFAEDSGDVREMIAKASGGYRIDQPWQGQEDQKRAIEILSHIPAGIAVFSVSDTSELKRIYLSEQAKVSAHVTTAGDSTLNELVCNVHPEDRRYVYDTVHTHVQKKELADLEFRIIGDDGKIYWDRLTLMPYLQEDGTYLLYGVYTDITELKQQTEQLRVQSLTDGLTGLKNRHALRDDFNSLIGASTTMVMMDIDHFKYFNDWFGHDAGDEVIRLCASLMMKLFTGDWCYRYGGDEFLIISTKRDKSDTLHKMEELSEQIRSTHLCDEYPQIEISYGVLTGTPKTDQDVRLLFKDADNLLYEIKQKKKAALGVLPEEIFPGGGARRRQLMQRGRR